MRTPLLIAATLLLGYATVPAQTNLGDRIINLKDATVRFSYAVRQGICGDGASMIRDRTSGEDNYPSFDEVDSGTSGRSWRDSDDPRVLALFEEILAKP